LALNRVPQVSIEIDPMIVFDHISTGLDVHDWFNAGEMEFVLETVSNQFDQLLGRDMAEDVTYEAMEDDALPDGVPDTLWPTDNEWGIPLLDIERQADAFDVPIETWGAKGRKLKAGTYHFYTEDYRYNAIWRNPDALIKAGCVNAVEPNFSVYDQVPRAVALWATFKKRWLARYWQSRGVRIFVDLNVARPYDDLNLLGVPKGWKSFATRGYESRLDGIAEELEIARDIAGVSGVLFLVYGGSAKVRDWCNANGAVWVAEDMDRAKGKYLNASKDNA
jgi:hypothetical protein